MKADIPRNSTSVIGIVRFFDVEKEPLTSLTPSTDITAWYLQDGGAKTAPTVEDASAIGAWEEPTSSAHVKMKEISDGCYIVYFPDAAFTHTGRWVTWVFLTADAPDGTAAQYVFTSSPVYTISNTTQYIDATQAETTLTVFQSAGSPSVSWSEFTNEADLDTEVLQMAVRDQDGTAKFALEYGGNGSGLTVSGASNNIVTADFTAAQLATLGDFPYDLWIRNEGSSEGEDRVLARGQLKVLGTSKPALAS